MQKRCSNKAKNFDALCDQIGQESCQTWKNAEMTKCTGYGNCKASANVEKCHTSRRDAVKSFKDTASDTSLSHAEIGNCYASSLAQTKQCFNQVNTEVAVMLEGV